MELAAYVESYSNHPISKSLKEAWERRSTRQGKRRRGDRRTGVTAMVDERQVAAGNGKLMKHWVCPIQKAPESAQWSMWLWRAATGDTF